MRKPSLLIGVALTLSLAVAAILLYHFYWRTYHGYTPEPFSTPAWLAADPEHRGYMADDLLQKHPLKGLTHKEVVALLGEPDHTILDDHARRPTSISYDLGYRGFNPNALMTPTHSLNVHLNENGTVTDTTILD